MLFRLVKYPSPLAEKKMFLLLTTSSSSRRRTMKELLVAISTDLGSHSDDVNLMEKKHAAKTTKGMVMQNIMKTSLRKSKFSPQITTRKSTYPPEARLDPQLGIAASEENIPNRITMDTTTDGDCTYDEDGTFTTDGKDGTDPISGESNEESQVDDSRSLDSIPLPLSHKNETVVNMDVITHNPGEPSQLFVRAMYCTPFPSSPDDIIIKVEASTVTFKDCLLRRGIGVEKVTFPFIPGCELVGTISSLGKAAEKEGYRVGDRVVGMTRRGGCNGKYAKFSSLHVAPVSSTSLDAAEMACLVNVYMTAYQALRLGKKDGTPLTQANVLITDGYSPLGQAATQLARLEGANVWVTTNDNFEDEHMKSLGAKCLRLLPHNWLHLVKGKMDVVIDNTCIDSYESSWQALNSAGVLVCTGMTSIHDFQADGGLCGCDALGDIRDYKAKWVALKAKYLMSQTKFLDLFESFQKDPKQYRQELKYLCFLVENSMLKPIIADRIPIEDVPDAHRYLETGKVNGTIVCIV